MQGLDIGTDLYFVLEPLESPLWSHLRFLLKGVNLVSVKSENTAIIFYSYFAMHNIGYLLDDTLGGSSRLKYILVSPLFRPLPTSPTTETQKTGI